MGNYDNAPIVDANADQVLVEQLNATIGVAFQDTAISNDTSKHKPAPIKLVTIVGLPVNDVTGAINGIYGADLSASDAYNLLLDPKSKPNSLKFKVAAVPHVSAPSWAMTSSTTRHHFQQGGGAQFALNDAGGPASLLLLTLPVIFQ